MKLTYSQALKVWWSFVWRNILLTIPAIMVFGIVVAVFAVGSMKGALQWALQVRWSDFRLVVTPAEDK
jgi:hypothetical protein